MATPLPMHDATSLADHITVGLSKVAAALRHQAWEGGTAQRLTPTQGQILLFLAARAPYPVRLNDVAADLCLTPATASDAVAALEAKHLVKKARSAEDHRALTITLTSSGHRHARRSAGWTDVVRAGVACMTGEEQAVFLRGLMKVIRSLQEQGVISLVRMCTACTYFDPYRHAVPGKPHHCGFINQPIGEAQLRLDCGDFVASEPGEERRRWPLFAEGPSQ